MILLLLTACVGTGGVDTDTAPDDKPADRPPEVSFLAPAAGAEVQEGDDLALVVRITDEETPVADLTVRFEEGGGSALDGQLSRVGDEVTLVVAGGLPAGAHTLYAWVTDEAGQASSDELELGVYEEAPPTVVFLAPAEGAGLPVDEPVVVDVEVFDPDAADEGALTLTWSGSAATAALPAAPDADGHARAELTLAVGEWSLHVDVTDSRGATAAAEVAFTVELPDRDGDGHADADVGGDDCDDADASVYPGADERCDGADDDCDGAIDDGVLLSWYGDADGDGYGRDDAIVEACEAPEGTVGVGGDCDDALATVFPGAPEVCNGADDDCDGAIDDGVLLDWYSDADGDGYGDGSAGVQACEAPEGYVADATDCDDTLGSIYPGAPESCDEADDDCDGAVDEGVAPTWYADLDADGYGDPDLTVEACTVPAGFVADATDCDDGAGWVYPGAEEVCDEVDDDCDGAVDEDVVPTWYADADGDGYGNHEVPTEACELPEGYVADATDCNDDYADVYPGATEVCDERDQDCDGAIDEGVVSTWYYDGDGDGVGLSTVVYSACPAPEGYVAASGDCDDTDATVYPDAPELCDDVDNDCDRRVDEGLTRVTWYGDADGDGYGVPTSVTSGCRAPAGYAATSDDCDDTDGAVNPGAAEVCDNGVDDDCSGGDEVCPEAAAYALADAPTSFGAEPGRVGLGGSVAAGGDLDGDGRGDLVFGVPTDDGSGGSAGAALVYSGAATGDLGEADAFVVLEGTAGALAGGAVLLPGDLDGDGADDLLVAAPGLDGTYGGGGAAWLLPGPLSAASTLDGARLEGAADGEAFPASLFALGDVSDDGRPDVGAWIDGEGVYALITGWPGGAESWESWAWVFALDDAADHSAAAAGGAAGDLDGDGIDDLALGASGADGGDGAVYVRYGPIAGDLGPDDADLVIEGSANEALGWSLVGAVDLDVDGYGDLVVGAPEADGAGLVYLVAGDGLCSGSASTLAAGRVTGTEAGARFGYRAAAPGDLDGDGAVDLLVTAPGSSLGGVGGGAAFRFGSGAWPTVDDVDADGLVLPEAAGDELGTVTSAGDLDGDGVPDLLFGAGSAAGGAGGAWLVSGAAL